MVVVAVAGILYAGTSWAGAEGPPVSRVVTPGDTLWSITTAHYPPSEDPRVAIEEIRRVNGLEGYWIQPGMRLELPPVDS